MKQSRTVASHLLQHSQSQKLPIFIQSHPRSRALLQELEKLRSGNAEFVRYRRHLKAGCLKLVEGFRHDRREVLVLGCNDELPATHSFPPRFRCLTLGGFAVLDGQPEPKSFQGDLPVFSLAAALRRFGRDARGFVQQHDGSLGLVSVLATGARAFRPSFAAGSQKGGNVKGGRMHGYDLVH